MLFSFVPFEVGLQKLVERPVKVRQTSFFQIPESPTLKVEVLQKGGDVATISPLCLAVMQRLKIFHPELLKRSTRQFRLRRSDERDFRQVIIIRGHLCMIAQITMPNLQARQLKNKGGEDET